MSDARRKRVSVRASTTMPNAASSNARLCGSGIAVAELGGVAEPGVVEPGGVVVLGGVAALGEMECFARPV